MHRELVDTVNAMIAEAIDSNITKNIAKLLKQQHTHLIEAGFDYHEATQLLIAISGKKS
jgi:hypothetical protein